MTPKDLKSLIAKETGIPRNVVSLVLDKQEDILADCIKRMETCYIGNMFIIRSRYRDFSVIQDGKRITVERMAVNVKPRKPFRRVLNGKIRRTNK